MNSKRNQYGAVRKQQRFLAGFLFRLIFDLEDGANIFLQNLV
jgi:hypothetical protein